MKKNGFLIASSLLFLCNFVTGQTIRWAQHVTGESAEQPKHSVTDAAGNTYIMGSLVGSIDFDPGLGSAIISSQGPKADIYLAKYNKAGERVWIGCIGGSGVQNPGRLLCDKEGNLLICGNFTGKTDANPGWEQQVIDAGLQNRHGFIVKINGDGQFQWVTHIPGVDVFLEDIAEGDSSYFITGSFFSNVDVAPGVPGGLTLSTGDEDIVLLKLNNDGTVQWGKSIGGKKRDRSTAVTCLNGDVIIAGTFRDTLDIDPSVSVVPVGTGDSTAIFLLRLGQSDGAYVAHGVMGGSETATVQSIIAQTDGRLVVAGIFNGTFDFDPQADTSLQTSEGGFDVFILGVGSSLHLGWSGFVAGTGYQDCRGLNIDTEKRIFVTGTFNGETDFDPTGYEQKRSPAGGTDIYLVELNEHGNLLCFESFGGTGNDGASGISSDADGNLYLSGYYAGQFVGDTDIDPSGTQLLLPSYTPLSDLFLASYIQCVEPVGLKNNESQTLLVYPNPANDAIFIPNQPHAAAYRVYDLKGRLIQSGSVGATGQIDISQLPQGLYHLRLDGIPGLVKFIKE